MKHGNVFVISAPSGAGKSTLVKKLCRLDSHIKPSISYTTRKIRNGEIDGVDYHFIDTQTFNLMLKNNEFLEYAEVYGNYYGTSIKIINELLAQGNDIILEIDHQGAKQIKQLIQNAILIYIKPPSLEELANRLKQRNTDTSNTIKHRLSLATHDMNHADNFDHVIINDKFDFALQQLYSIILQYRNHNI